MALRPQLALSETFNDLNVYRQHLPVYGSYKLDGIRALDVPDPATSLQYMASRSLKPIKSSYAQGLALPEYNLFDGELLSKPKELPEGQTIYSSTFSDVMTHGCTEPIDWWIFDWADPWLSEDHKGKIKYVDRLNIVKETLAKHPHPDIHVLEQRILETPEDIAAMEKEALDLQFEGLIIRRMDAPYHCNRSSFKQGYLMKIVRVLQSDAVIEDITEMMHNDNEAKIDARGFTTRSSHQDNKTGLGMLGAFMARDAHGLFEGNVWKCGMGPGVDHAFREDIFKNWPRDKGRMFKYTYKPYGTKYLPRQPKWIGWRDPTDMG